MDDWLRETASSGSLLLAIPVALAAGLVSFFSPCVIPLLPGYVSYATGLSGADLANGVAGTRRGRMLLGSLLFVAGFATVFVMLGFASGALGRRLVEWQDQFTIVLGVLMIVLGLVFAGWLPLLQREWRIHAIPAVGLAAAPVIGFLFGLGWLPCTGPTLGAILSLAFYESTATRGAFLAAVYAIGLGIPFIVAGLAYEKTLAALGWVRRHQQWVMRAGGVMLLLVGVLLLTGWWTELVTWLQVRLVGSSETLL